MHTYGVVVAKTHSSCKVVIVNNVVLCQEHIRVTEGDTIQCGLMVKLKHAMCLCARARACVCVFFFSDKVNVSFNIGL
jgi:hypothetical protein